MTGVHVFVYNESMKKKDVEKQLTQFGWWIERHGGNHDIWTNGEVKIPVPRHKEINELTAKSIIKMAKKNKI